MTQLRSPLQAQVVQWLVAPGDAVREGDVLVILEAMKMEHEVRSPGDGVVGERFFAEGETVQQDEVLLTIAAASAPTPAAPQRGREPQPAPTAVRPDLRRVLDRRQPAGNAERVEGGKTRAGCLTHQQPSTPAKHAEALPHDRLLHLRVRQIEQKSLGYDGIDRG